MSASTFLTQESLWPTLKELARECQQRKLVAVPYIGKDGAKPLKLDEGDVLICALTEANAKKGLVCPDEIARLQRKGVKVYIQDHLHAKVYLIGRTAVVCSANLSQSSVNNLDEAGLLITDQKVTPTIRDWFRERMGQEVTPEWLEHCKEVYKPPKGEVVPSNGRKPRGVGTGTWLIGVNDTERPDDEMAAYESGYHEAKKRLRKGIGLQLPQNLISKEITNSSNAQRIQLMASPEKLQR